MTTKRFTLVDDDFISRIKDNGISMTAREIVECLNTLYEENEQLKQRITDIITIDARDYNDLYEEKEVWKSNCFKEVNQNQILWNEIHILMEQGAEPSDAFKEYLDSISTKYDKFWQRKLQQAKKDNVI